MAKLKSPVVAREVPTSRGLFRWWRSWLSGSFRAGVFHAVGLAVGGDDDGVVQEPVEEADGGGVLG